MTKFIAAFFFLFAVALARAPLKSLDKDDVTTSESLPLTDESSVIRIPTAEILNAGEINQPVEPDSLIVHTVPLDFSTARFRPINRRFYLRTKYPVRNCRHHYHQNRDDFFKMKRVEIPYGDDMIVSSGENSDFEEPPTFRGVRRVPGRWARLHHQHQHENDDEDNDNNGATRIVLKRKIFNRIDREKKWKKHFRENEIAGDHKKVKHGGLMKRVRKFLDNYF
ncbi:uncharacterized protein Fot_12644 [Forsythia ovata]|uniref:Uncharacterized protein n=1 Tax=Forsythia ovata TaxID=205694 RepID=A0ABD1WN54_9LAMI